MLRCILQCMYVSCSKKGHFLGPFHFYNITQYNSGEPSMYSLVSLSLDVYMSNLALDCPHILQISFPFEFFFAFGAVDFFGCNGLALNSWVDPLWGCRCSITSIGYYIIITSIGCCTSISDMSLYIFKCGLVWPYLPICTSCE